MESPFFKIVSHTIPASHIREYPRATSSNAVDLRLCIKQYIPRSNGDPKSGDLTLVATHGSGLPKVCTFEYSLENIALISFRNSMSPCGRIYAPIPSNMGSELGPSGLQMPLIREPVVC